MSDWARWSLDGEPGYAEAGDGLQVWARASIPEAHLNLVNAYGQSDDWPAAEAVLNDQREILTGPQFRAT